MSNSNENNENNVEEINRNEKEDLLDDMENELKIRKIKKITLNEFLSFRHLFNRTRWIVVILMIFLNFMFNWQFIFASSLNSYDISIQILFPDPFPLLGYFISFGNTFNHPSQLFNTLMILQEILRISTISFLSGGFLSSFKEPISTRTFQGYLQKCWDYFPKLLLYNCALYVFFIILSPLLSLLSWFGFIILILLNYFTFLVPFIIVLYDESIINSIYFSVHTCTKLKIFLYILFYVIIIGLFAFFINGMMQEPFAGVMLCIITPFLTVFIVGDACERISFDFKGEIKQAKKQQEKRRLNSSVFGVDGMLTKDDK